MQSVLFPNMTMPGKGMFSYLFWLFLSLRRERTKKLKKLKKKGKLFWKACNLYIYTLYIGVGFLELRKNTNNHLAGIQLLYPNIQISSFAPSAVSALTCQLPAQCSLFPPGLPPAINGTEPQTPLLTPGSPPLRRHWAPSTPWGLPEARLPPVQSDISRLDQIAVYSFIIFFNMVCLQNHLNRSWIHKYSPSKLTHKGLLRNSFVH